MILEMAEFKKYGGTSIGPESLSDTERPSDNLEIDEIMAKLEQVTSLSSCLGFCDVIFSLLMTGFRFETILSLSSRPDAKRTWL